MKILAGRPKVLEDLRRVLEEQRARLDVDYIRSIVGILEQALGQSDLPPALEVEITRGGQAAALTLVSPSGATGQNSPVDVTRAEIII